MVKKENPTHTITWEGTIVCLQSTNDETESIYIPTNSARGFPFLHSLLRICLYIYDDGHSDHCEVILHCSLDLHICNNCSTFPVSFGHLYVFFGGMSI